MYVAGYSFYLLNNAFTNHWGFQSLKTRPQWRARQQEQNNARFDEFAKEVSLEFYFLSYYYYETKFVHILQRKDCNYTFINLE